MAKRQIVQESDVRITQVRCADSDKVDLPTIQNNPVVHDQIPSDQTAQAEANQKDITGRVCIYDAPPGIVQPELQKARLASTQSLKYFAGTMGQAEHCLSATYLLRPACSEARGWPADLSA